MEPVLLNFRAAIPDDTELLLPLIRSAYRGEESRAGWTTEADLVADERIDTSGLLAKITAPDAVVLVITDGSTNPDAQALISCCELLWHPDSKTAYFGLFAVDPKKQGAGIGRQVLTYAEDYALSRWGAAKVEMTVIWQREDIIAWYARRGYRKTGEQRPFPYEGLVNGKALRDDLYFEVLVKELNGAEETS
jgi:ribosomal protein S18 acetylase RimI-like enzyme